MTIRSQLLNAAVATAVAAGTLVPLATSAHAGQRDWNGHNGYNRRHHESYDDRRFDTHRYAGPHHERHVYRKKKRNNVGPAIAIGLGALVLGIIASESGRSHRYSDDD